MIKKQIELGDTVRCIYTGLTGITVSKIIFINECIQFELATKVGKDNKLAEGTYIDSQSLVIISRGVKGRQVDAIEKAKIQEMKKAERATSEMIRNKTYEPTGGPNHKHIKMVGH